MQPYRCLKACRDLGFGESGNGRSIDFLDVQTGVVHCKLSGQERTDVYVASENLKRFYTCHKFPERINVSFTEIFQVTLRLIFYYCVGKPELKNVIHYQFLN